MYFGTVKPYIKQTNGSGCFKHFFLYICKTNLFLGDTSYKAVIGNLLVTPYKGFTVFRTQQLRKQRKHQEQEAEKF